MKNSQPSVVLTVLLIIALLPPPLFSQSPRAKSARRPDVSASVITELLRQRPLEPAEPENAEPAAKPGDDTDEEDEKPPADDAPIRKLIEFWSRHSDSSGPAAPKLSDTVRQRLLEAGENRPWLLPGLLNFLPDTPDTHDRLYKLLTENPDEKEEEWPKPVKGWLQLHSRYFRDELLASLTPARDDVMALTQGQKLAALARLDWDAARPLIERDAASSIPLVAVMSMWLQYKHACESGETAQIENLRARLKSLVTNPQADLTTRKVAFEMLIEIEWSGQEEWVLSLFSDPALSGPQAAKSDNNLRTEKNVEGQDEESETGDPRDRILSDLISQQPDKWLPFVSRLVGHDSPTVHNAAVSSLVIYAINEVQNKKLRKEAARALLPWLSNSSWTTASGRLGFIASLAKLKLPESVPGLIRVLDYDEDASARVAAAEALATYRDPRAVPALRRALEKESAESNEFLRHLLVTALAQCGGISDEEAAAAIEAYARMMVTEKGEKEIEQATKGGGGKPLPLEVSIGRVLYESETIQATEGMAFRLFERVKALRASHPAMAQKILEGIQGVPLRIAELNLIERIGAGTADLSAVRLALDTRASLRKNVGDEIFPLLKQGGHVAGIAAVMLADEGRQADLLKGSDLKAQRSLLACARYVCDKLPVELVGGLLNAPDKLLASAAESYLEVEDSAAARKLVLARHPGQALILGDRGLFADRENPADENWFGGGVQKWEARLRDEVLKPGVAEEIYALLNTVAYQSIVIRVRNGRAELSYYLDEHRRQVRLLSESEWQELKDFAARQEVEDLGPEQGIGWRESTDKREYLRLTRDGGRRIITDALMRAPKKDATLHEQLSGIFYRLWKAGEYKVRYAIKDRVPGLEVLMSDRSHQIISICQEGRELRVLAAEKAEDRRTESMPEWRAFNSGQFGAVVDAPPACSSFNLSIIDEMREWSRKIEHDESGSPLNALAGNSFYLAGRWNQEPGIWKVSSGGSPVKIIGGRWRHLLVTPDERWLIALRSTDTAGRSVEQLVRINLQNGRDFVINLPDGYARFPIAFIPASKKVLFAAPDVSSRDNGSGRGVLLDPDSGAMQPITGELRLWFDDLLHPLQPTGRPDEVWAAIYDGQKNSTAIGRYNVRIFSFAPVIELPELKFGNPEIWIDQAAGWIYVTFRDDLLRLPLPAAGR
ncbi:MAG: HEAT repeat domain-containing protein [Blastocatellia bacterium]